MEMDPNKLPKGITIGDTLAIQSADNPVTRVALDVFRQYRKTNPDWKMLVLNTRVCRSYPRWANIGLTPKVMPFKIPLAVFVIRRPAKDVEGEGNGHPSKEIVLLDPTNAHFHETASSPEQGIFYDVAQEIIDKIHYAIKCPCPISSPCTCGKGWTINFLKSREHPRIQQFYPGIIDLYREKPGDVLATSYAWHVGKIVEEQRDQFLASVDQLPPWEDSDMVAMMGEMKRKMGCTDEQFRTGEGIEKPPPAQMLNPFVPLSVSNCENCGKDEKLGDELKRCGRCKSVRYCSKKCQNMDWPRHKRGCVPPIKDLGGGTVLMPPMGFDLVTKQLYFKGAESQPKLQKKKNSK